MAASIHDHLTDQLFKVILSLKDQEQCYKFFEDICTVSELKAMAQRLEVARMLDEGCTPRRRKTTKFLRRFLTISYRR